MGGGWLGLVVQGRAEPAVNRLPACLPACCALLCLRWRQASMLVGPALSTWHCTGA